MCSERDKPDCPTVSAPTRQFGQFHDRPAPETDHGRARGGQFGQSGALDPVRHMPGVLAKPPPRRAMVASSHDRKLDVSPPLSRCPLRPGDAYFD